MEQQKLTIRFAGEEDAAALAEIYRPYVEKTAITFEYEAPDQAEFARRIAHTLQRYPYLIAELDGTVVGYAYVGPLHSRPAYDWSVETSIYVAEGEHGHGTGRALYEKMETVLRLQNVVSVNACIAYPEKEDEYLTYASVRFHQKLGYTMVGQFHQCAYKFKRWYGMAWMEKSIAPRLEDQPPFRPFPCVREEAERLLAR